MSIAAYWWAVRRNFGDLLAEFLIECLTGQKPVLCDIAPRLLSVGSVFHFARPFDVVWGSGIRLAEDVLATPLDVRAVRGPLTRRQLNRRQPGICEIYGDPALLLPKYHAPATNRKQGVTVIPHFSDFLLHGGDRELSVEGDPFQLIDEIVSSDVVATSSLHVLIVAEAYGVPVVLVRNTRHLSQEPHFKFLDYFASTGRGDCSFWDVSVEEAVCRIDTIPTPVFPDLRKLVDAFPWDRLDELSVEGWDA